MPDSASPGFGMRGRVSSRSSPPQSDSTSSWSEAESSASRRLTSTAASRRMARGWHRAALRGWIPANLVADLAAAARGGAERHRRARSKQLRSDPWDRLALAVAGCTLSNDRDLGGLIRTRGRSTSVMRMQHWLGGMIVTFGLVVPGCGSLFEPKDGRLTDGTSDGDTGGFETGLESDATGFDDSTADDSTEEGRGETGRFDLGGGCEATPSIDPRRSLIETSPAALAGITMAQILSAAADGVDLVVDPQFTYTRLIDSFTAAELGALPGGWH